MRKCNAIISKLSKNAREINAKIKNIRIRWKIKNRKYYKWNKAICKTRGFENGMEK